MKKRLLITFLSLSLVSLFADMTYEGARSIIGAYFELLGATAVVAGFVGIGEFIGYLMRGVGGFIAGLSKSSKVYWSLVYMGYAINLFAIPLLGLVGDWRTALVLVLVERIGKGLRTPARDVILAEVTEGIGRGKGFGLHELFDQIGAIAGPSIVLYVLARSNIRTAFITLALPAIAALSFLVIASINYPHIRSIEGRGKSFRKSYGGGLGKIFWLYIASTILFSLGFIHWSLFIYHVSYVGLIETKLIPTLYILAMAVDAAVAFPAGYLYDKVGPVSIVFTPAVTALVVPLLLTNNVGLVFASSILWGIVMGIFETNMRVIVADIVSPEKRAYAYGLYGTLYGLSWGLGNTLMGALYTLNKQYLIIYTVIVELTALIVMARVVYEIYRERKHIR